MTNYILSIICTDQKGLVHKITGVLFQSDTNVERTDEYVDPDTETFFMRVLYSGEADSNDILRKLKNILPEKAQIDVQIQRKKNVVVLATKEHHCLSDLLIRNEFNDLPFNILAVISNHDSLQDLVSKFGVKYHYLPAEGTEIEDRLKHEKELNEVLSNYEFDYIILAKFMRILTPQFTEKYQYKLINIHHSFLPAFIGANPYRQAHERGVKIIGATAHFVTDDLDEGPIIFQDVIAVNHTKTVAEIAAAGRDVEKIVLAKALKLVFEDRVFISGNKTIIFE
ncbi:MAG: formyltetrahydrofolate deformylase [Bacteroidota bacterium]